MDQVHVRSDIRCAWHGPSLLVTTPRGSCGEELTLSGYYFRETRHLRTLRFEIDGESPWLCESVVHEPQRLSFTFIHPELTHFSGGGTARAEAEFPIADAHIPWRALDIQLVLEVALGGLSAELTIANRSSKSVAFDLAWIIGADFADLLEVDGDIRDPVPVRSEHGDGSLRFIRLDERLPLETICRAEGDAWHVSDDRLTMHLALAPHSSFAGCLRVEPVDPAGPAPGPDREALWVGWRDALTVIEMPGAGGIEHIVRRNVLDFASLPLLEGADDECLAPQAGVPLYPALFGRDALTATWQAALLDRGEALDGALTRLGRLQGTRDDPERDEAPGRILQQTRSGPLSRLGVLPLGRYYGDYASPLMYVIALAHRFAWTGERSVLLRHWDIARRVLDWARDRGDIDGDGYLEYQSRSSLGTQNQGWKDSGDAIVYDDGTPVSPPLGTCELQGYWYAAQQLMAVLSWVLGYRDDAHAYWDGAVALKERFNREWWLEDQGFIALARDSEKRLVHAPGTNAGHCLATGIVAAEHMPRLVERLFQPDLFNGWGIRTLSADHRAYDPVSYHRGSVWAVENATIVFGLRRFGFDARVLELSRALFDLAGLYPDLRIPETVGGYARADRATPALYPRANPVQLWNASGFALMVHAILGLQPVGLLDLLVVDPILPDWMPEVVLRGLRLGGATVTLRFSRDADGHSHAEVLEQQGTLHLLRQPPPESLSVGMRDRFSALVERVMHR